MVTIYALICVATGKAYIGCTRGPLPKRFREHRSNLNKGIHSEKMLLADWNIFGEKNFSMIPLYQLDDDAPVQALRQLEMFAMKRFKERGCLYNQNEACFQPVRLAIERGVPKATATIGNRWSAEANAKRRMTQLGKPKHHGAKISATKKRLGQRPTLEAAKAGGIAACKKRWQMMR